MPFLLALRTGACLLKVCSPTCNTKQRLQDLQRGTSDHLNEFRETWLLQLGLTVNLPNCDRTECMAHRQDVNLNVCTRVWEKAR